MFFEVVRGVKRSCDKRYFKQRKAEDSASRMLYLDVF